MTTEDRAEPVPEEVPEGDQVDRGDNQVDDAEEEQDVFFNDNMEDEDDIIIDEGFEDNELAEEEVYLRELTGQVY